MHLPRRRVTRSGPAQPRLRTSRLTVLAAAFALLLSACGPDTRTAGPAGSAGLQALEAEAAAIVGDGLVVAEDDGASQGRALVVAEGTRPAAAPAEDAALTFRAPAAARYLLWARVKGASEEGGALYIGFDGALEQVRAPAVGEYAWTAVAVAELEPGEHVVSLGAAEPGASVDAVVVTTRRDLGGEDLEAYVMEGRAPERPAGERPPGGGRGAGPGEVPIAEPDEAPGAPVGQPGGEPGETPGEAPDTGKDDGPTTAPGGSKPSPSRPFDLRGDPGFDVSDLPAEAQVWYRRLWQSIDDSIYDVDSWARSDNLYKYARDLHTHVQFLLHAFRATGDLRLLDEVDRIVELMRSKLDDSWRDVRSGSAAPGKDGYLNWVWRGSGADQYYGKDDHQLDEIKTHALIASVAWALEVNRDLKSPGGRDYAAHADFWKGYLKDHFEAKWRERMKKPSGFPIMIRPHTHTYYSWTKWHYYMSLLTGDQAYLKEAQRMAGMLQRDIVEVSTGSGTAYVWTRSVLSEGGKENYLHPNVYARYVYHDAIEFYFEGFGWWDDRALAAMARTFATWVIDPEHAKGSRDWFTGDIGGDKPRGGIPTDGWNRMDYYRYEASSFAEIAPWDASGAIDAMTDKVLDKVGDPAKPRYLALPTAKLITALLD